MKKLFTTLAILSIALVSKAGYYSESVLSVSTYDGGRIVISVDRMQPTAPAQTVYINNLDEGNHYVRIMRLTGNMYYPVYRTIFSGMIYIPYATEVVASVTRNTFRIREQRPLFPPAPEVYEQPHYYPSHQNYVSEVDFNQMLQSIHSRSFESTRITLAKQFIASNYFSSAQIARIMREMSFESSKLDVAKFAYLRTIDRQNYFVVNDEFSFESSIAELSNYITAQG
ncbi:MAG: DUF4476 domain-containing protein [Bacteroidetes bacterium]|jgi:hypothetical protein|nr:DUF4476 domain-containing protein [Bacteroidota bacterium]